MKIADLIDDHNNSNDACLHQLSVDEFVSEVLKSRKDVAKDPPPLLSSGRSAHQTASPNLNTGTFLPPSGSRMHGYIGVDAGAVGILHAEILCSPDRLLLVAFATVEQYRQLRADSALRTRAQTAMFNGIARADSYYDTLETALRTPCEQTRDQFFVHIPNGLAFLRCCEVGCGLRPCFLKTTGDFTGLFRYYTSLSQPSLHFVLQVQAEVTQASHGQGSPIPGAMSNSVDSASIEAVSTFLTNRNPDQDGTWAGATEEAETPTASETATVIAQLVHSNSASPRATVALRRLKRALGQ